MAGYPLDQNSFNQRTGRAVVGLRDALAECTAIKALLDDTSIFGNPDNSQIIALGFTSAEAVQFRAAFAALAKLDQISHGQAMQSPASDFFFDAKHLGGSNVVIAGEVPRLGAIRDRCTPASRLHSSPPEPPRRHACTDFSPLGAIAPSPASAGPTPCPAAPTTSSVHRPGLPRPRPAPGPRRRAHRRSLARRHLPVGRHPRPAHPRRRRLVGHRQGRGHLRRRVPGHLDDLDRCQHQPHPGRRRAARAAAVEADHLLQHEPVPRRPAAVRHRDHHRPAEPGDQARLLHVARRPPQPAVDLPRAHRDDPDPVLLEPHGAVAGRVLQRAVRPVPVRGGQRRHRRRGGQLADVGHQHGVDRPARPQRAAVGHHRRGHPVRRHGPGLGAGGASPGTARRRSPGRSPSPAASTPT